MKSPRSTAPAALLRVLDPSPEPPSSPAATEVELDAEFDADLELEDDVEAEAEAEGEADVEAQRLAVQTRLRAYFTKGRPRVVFTDNLHTMLSIKRGQGVWTLRMHQMFATAPPAVLRAVAQYAQTQDRQAAALLRRYIDHNDHQIRPQAEPRAQVIDVQGAHHNLQATFDELNARYFAGAITARITWGPRTRRRSGRESIKLGSYSVEEELIRIHPVLDASDVPPFFLAWIIYHEMLHEVHDMPIVDGRRVYHTPEFRRAEARFERYAEAVLWERTQVHKLLDR
ncbi:hypothetical protein [Nannocystis sp.]|uniref:hypothetical protein n=1 Tax=Nannocystis sp. TaxID=1962667 RepID=UPI002428D9CF|nr:hypothetical protein [Nannocystis sp.]MBK7826842.1 hypothetical protein [Nannocystis sp.]MBK9758350.1 hypothetical protein [Nannocystis sp.]